MIFYGSLNFSLNLYVVGVIILLERFRYCVFKVAQLCRGHKAWPGDIPTLFEINRLFETHPNTTCLAVSRRGCALINSLAVEAFFGDKKPLTILPGDIEANADNYHEGKLIQETSKLRSLKVPIYIGLEIFFTRNVNKGIDFVNGMKARVIGWDASSRGLHLITATGHYVTTWMWTDKELANRSYYPIRPGYCSTIVKYQGAELEHVTVYLDTPGVPGEHFLLSVISLLPTPFKH